MYRITSKLIKNYSKIIFSMFYSSDQATGWTTKEEVFGSLQGEKCSPSETCPDGSAIHTTCCLMCTGGFLLMVKAAKALISNYLRFVLGLRMSGALISRLPYTFMA
jgi:hypothetical protein